MTSESDLRHVVRALLLATRTDPDERVSADDVSRFIANLTSDPPAATVNPWLDPPSYD